MYKPHRYNHTHTKLTSEVKSRSVLGWLTVQIGGPDRVKRTVTVTKGCLLRGASFFAILKRIIIEYQTLTLHSKNSFYTSILYTLISYLGSILNQLRAL